MTSRPTAAVAGARAWLEAAWLLAALTVIVLGRAWGTKTGLDPLALGAAFGIALIVLVAVSASGHGQRTAVGIEGGIGAGLRAVAIGVAFGLVLVGLAAAGVAIGGAIVVPGLGRPAAPFASWAAITVLVATAEELLLRGRLFDAAQRAGGVWVAVLLSTLAFALMHVPLYGCGVVPLDVAVGFALGGLRLATGGVVAPAAAHAVADLATWWL